MCVLFFTRFRFLVRHLDFRENGASDKVGTNTVENLDPENIGVDTEIMFVSRRVPKLEGAATLHPPGLSCKKSIRRPTINAAYCGHGDMIVSASALSPQGHSDKIGLECDG